MSNLELPGTAHADGGSASRGGSRADVAGAWPLSSGEHGGGLDFDQQVGLTEG